jgi:hypothetical protein
MSFCYGRLDILQLSKCFVSADWQWLTFDRMQSERLMTHDSWLGKKAFATGFDSVQYGHEAEIPEPPDMCRDKWNLYSEICREKI